MNNPLLRLLLARLNEAQTDLNRLGLYASGRTLGVNGSFWRGRKGKGGDMTQVLTSLVQDDQIGPAIKRIVDGQLDKDPDWQAVEGALTLVSSGAVVPEGSSESVRPDERVDAMTTWHTEAALITALRSAAWAYQWAGRMVLRVYIPDEYRDLIESRAAWTLAEALELVYVQAVDPRDGGPVIDAHGRVLGYFFAYQVTDPVRRTTTKWVEFHTQDTVQLYQRVGGLALNPVGEPMPNPLYDETRLGSRRREYLMWHADRLGGTAITPSAIDAQDRLNAANTYMGRNDDMTGFRMIVTGNAETPVDDLGKPTTWKAGPDVVITLIGIPKDDRDNPTDGGRETPTFQIIDPVDPRSHSIPSINHWGRKVMAAFDQGWAADGELEVSGESKRVSRKPHDKRVIFASVDTGAGMAWALRAGLMLASSLVGEEALREAAAVRFRPRMYLDVDSANLAEYVAKLTAYEKGALDLESLLESTPGLTDVASAKARVEAEQAAKAKEAGTGAAGA